MATRIPLTILCAALLMIVACERTPESADTSDAAAEAAPIAGMYEVKGATVDSASGSKREISGTVILAEEGENYTATFHLATVVEGAEGVLPAEVIGKGEGIIEGRKLTGEAATQLVISSIPGIDPAFAFIPRSTTTRLVSKSVTTISADGKVEIEISNSPAPGEAYSPTRTTLRGRRVAAARIAGKGLPPVATPPPATSNQD
jgi:hypothetical protein